MDAGLYKSQFVHFLNLLYPCGLPEGSIAALKWQINGIEFRFSFDPNDLKAATDIDMRSLTENDIEFLSSLKITV